MEDKSSWISRSYVPTNQKKFVNPQTFARLKQRFHSICISCFPLEQTGVELSVPKEVMKTSSQNSMKLQIITYRTSAFFIPDIPTPEEIVLKQRVLSATVQGVKIKNLSNPIHYVIPNIEVRDYCVACVNLFANFQLTASLIGILWNKMVLSLLFFQSDANHTCVYWEHNRKL